MDQLARLARRLKLFSGPGLECGVMARVMSAPRHFLSGEM